MKLTYEKLEAEIWAARKRFKKDKDFIPFIAGWIWSLINDYEQGGNNGAETDLPGLRSAAVFGGGRADMAVYKMRGGDAGGRA